MSTSLIPSVSLRRGADRHQTRIGWLHGRHSFDTGIDALGADTHHGVLVVSNHDTIAPASGFETHPHRNMEIVTWVLSGSLVHQDSEGHNGVIYPNLAQRMTAGTGIRHSEKNDRSAVDPDAGQPLDLVQMWVVPDEREAAPGYEQLELARPTSRAGWRWWRPGWSGTGTRRPSGSGTATPPSTSPG